MLRKNIRDIKRLPGKLAPYLRVRHVRGRGVHSPYAYGIIRNALLFGKGYTGRTGAIYTYLKLIGVRKRYAMQLQNLHNYCDYRSTVIYNCTGIDVLGEGSPTMHVFAPGCTAEAISKAVYTFKNEYGAVAILSPRSDKAKLTLCENLSGQGDCISIDNRGFMLFFYESGHSPKHYKL